MKVTATNTGDATPMIDIGAVPLSELLDYAGDTVLADALRRIIGAALDNAGNDVSEFESSI
jgi:FXSXX-COOH protein